ncbi:hypothetical protein BG842_12085 [Haladaptatus sp. W1]|nr:hypothetical protein BG842_12085 [Haladaptatus sp. W1]
MLKQTSELVIIGCSIRKQDEVLNKLLENNLEDEIDVILAVGSQIDGVKNRLNDLSVDFNFVDEIRYFTDFSEKYL